NRGRSAPAKAASVRPVRVLPALELHEPIGRHLVLGAAGGQACQRGDERIAAFDAVLPGRRYTRGLVEAAERHRDAVLVDVAEEQGRAAVAAEAALGGGRAPEHARLSLHPREVLGRHAGEGGKVVADRLLT